jgi:dihydroflavonol-4-reductase
MAKWGIWFAPAGGNDFCDVRDVADGILAAMERGQPGRRYILGGEPLSYWEAFHLFCSLGGRQGPVIHAGPIMIWSASAFGTALGKLIRREPDLNLSAARMIARPHHYTYARAASELGYRPRPAREAAEAAWSWFCEHGYARATLIRRILYFPRIKPDEPAKPAGPE